MGGSIRPLERFSGGDDKRLVAGVAACGHADAAFARRTAWSGGDLGRQSTA